MAVIIGGIKQESNSFSPVPTTVKIFANGSLLYGNEIIEKMAGTRAGEGAFIDVLKKEGKDPVPTLTARATSGGAVTTEAYETLKNDLLERIRNATGDIEAVLLNMHGAMLSGDCDDAEGEIVREVRKIVGKDVPIGVSLDGHANVTPLLLENADVVTGYRTFPHTDEYETGVRAASLVMEMLKGTIRPVMGCVRVPMLIPPHSQQHYRGPLKELLDLCAELEKTKGVLDISLFPVQPWLDAPGTASSALVITDNDPALAKRLAARIATRFWEIRDEFTPDLMTPDEAVRHAIANPTKVMCISEASDAPPAGAPGDGICLLQTMLQYDLPAPAYYIAIDGEALDEAFKAKEGDTVTLSVGFKKDPRWGSPQKISGKLLKLAENTSYMAQQNNVAVNLGRTALIQIGNIFMALCANTFSHIDPRVYSALGLDPAKANILGAKSTLHFREFYKEVADEIILLDSDGPSTSRFDRLDWKRVSRPMWPLDDMEWNAEA